MDHFPQLLEEGFEGLHYFADRRTGLRALVGVHSTKLGPGIGGTRALATYDSEAAAVVDVLRLARGMTYKAALAGLPHGGGKAVIMLPRGWFDRQRLFESFGRAVDSLGGRYITTEDSGTSPDDMEHVSKVTRHVVGLKATSGDPSPVTAFGVVRGMEAVAKHAFGTTELKGLRVTLLGVGHVGLALAGELHRRGAKLFVADLDRSKVRRAVEEYGATAVSDHDLLTMEADIFAPCALGGTLNDRTVPMLKVKAVAGAANNQLESPRHGKLLAERGILYAPDYVINAGGIINVSLEYLCRQHDEPCDINEVRKRIAQIPERLRAIWRASEASGERPDVVADRMAQALIGRAPARERAAA